MSDPEENEEPVAQQRAGAENEAPKVVKRGGMTVGVVILLSLVWYLAADRYTPYTSQARVQGYVVGVAPQVAGTVVKVSIENNQQVEAGQELFQIDPAQYEIALAKARSSACTGKTRARSPPVAWKFRGQHWIPQKRLSQRQRPELPRRSSPWGAVPTRRPIPFSELRVPPWKKPNLT
jgi:hypothetical protein